MESEEFDRWHAAMSAKNYATALTVIPLPTPAPSATRANHPQNLTKGSFSEGASKSIAARKRKETATSEQRHKDEGETGAAGPDHIIPQGPVVMQHRLRNNLDYWKTFTKSQLVLSWIEHGFGLRWLSTTGAPAPAKFTNQPSAYEHSSFVSNQVDEMLEAGSIIQHFSAPTVISPLGVVAKKGTDKFRLIWDGRYVNEHIIVPKFKYDGLESLSDILQRNDFMVVVDFSKGYHHIDLHPDFYQFFGFEWQGLFYTYTSLPFGLASACWAFTKVTRELVYKWRATGHRCTGYLDDSLHAGQDQEALQRIMTTYIFPDLEACGFVINWKKTKIVPQQSKKYLGMIISTVDNCMVVPHERYEGLMDLLKEALTRAEACPIKILERITGNIISMFWAFGPLSRLMTMSIYADMNTRLRAQGYVSLSDTAIADLLFWSHCFKTFERTRRIWQDRTTPIIIFTDALMLRSKAAKALP
jgi:hypothetical protein